MKKSIGLLSLSLCIVAASHSLAIMPMSDKEAGNYKGLASSCSCVRDTNTFCTTTKLPRDCATQPISGPLITAGSVECQTPNAWESFVSQNKNRYCESLPTALLSFCVDYRNIKSCVYYRSNHCATHTHNTYVEEILTAITISCVHGNTGNIVTGFGRYNDAVGVPCP